MGNKMTFKNMNNERMKKVNVANVLKVIRENEPLSRNELSKITGMTSSSITNIVDRLMRKGFLRETGLGDSSGGRKPIMLMLNPEIKYIIGIEINVADIVSIITDFRAKVIKKIIIPTDIEYGKDFVLNKVVSLIQRLVNEANVPMEKILGIGIAAPGPYNHEKGVLINPPNFYKWINVPICEIINKKFNIPVYLEKETVAAALGEYMFGKEKNSKNLFVINAMMVGIGGGAIIEGKIFHGFSDGAGDIGHMTIDIDGPKCTCGSYGCLESLASGIFMVNKFISEVKSGESSELTAYLQNFEKVQVKDIIDFSRKGDGLCRRIIENAARNLGIGIANIINVFSPEIIILGGNLISLCPEYAKKAIEYAISKKYPIYNKNISIIKTSFDNEMCAIGAVGLVFQKFITTLEDV